jgi:hypothetical protein
METPGTPGPEDDTHRVPPPSYGQYGGGPQQPQQPQQSQQPLINFPTGARLPVPGNAEWALWFLVEILFAIIWAASDDVDAAAFVIATAVITFAYLISRGIAKASRVLEQ